MTDPRLKECLDRVTGLPASFTNKSRVLVNYVINSVNRFVNGFAYKKDRGGDYWKTPTEFFNDGGGDCEDFAIAKGVMLKNIFSDIELELVLCRNRATRQAHAILCVGTATGRRYLDNDYTISFDQQAFVKHYEEISRTEM